MHVVEFLFSDKSNSRTNADVGQSRYSFFILMNMCLNNGHILYNYYEGKDVSIRMFVEFIHFNVRYVNIEQCLHVVVASDHVVNALVGIYIMFFLSDGILNCTHTFN